MKHFTRLFLLSAASFIWVASASADFVSNSGTVAYTGYNSTRDVLCPGGAGCVFPGSTATVNIGTGTPTPGVWVGPIDGSSWVSFADTEPGSGNTPNNGTYTFRTAFTATAGETLSLSVLADDTTSVWLNGVQVLAATDSTISPTGKCDSGQPNCTEVLTFNIAGLNNGSNILVFGVDQDHDSALGLDFAGTLNAATPEPSSLLLLGTGLLGAAGALRRRIRA